MVFEKVKAILVDQLDVDEDDITMDTLIMEDLGADSLDIADITMSLEDAFDVEVSDDALATIKTVGDIVRHLEDNV